MKVELRRFTVSSPRAENARQSWPQRESLLIRISDTQGLAGIGEASPLPGYSPDQLADVERALAGVSPASLQRALETEGIAAALTAVAELASRGLPSARFALETAALDYLGTRDGQAAPALLGAAAGAERPLAELVGLATAADFGLQCERAIHAGFRHVKVKLGGPGGLEAELVALRATAARLGKAVRWRVDANTALAPGQIERAWATLQELELELFEEPGELPPPQLDPALPLALDESLQGLEVTSAVDRLKTTGARFAVLKPATLGGLAHCLALATHARGAGITSVVSHCFDGPIAFRAAAALALALPPDAAHGLAPHAALAGWPRPEPPVERGWLQTWTQAGLGLAPNAYFE